jgi:hypothetical protein
VSEPAGPPAKDHRRRPRRRAVLDAAILEATIAEIDETGYANPRKWNALPSGPGRARRRCTALAEQGRAGDDRPLCAASRSGRRRRHRQPPWRPAGPIPRRGGGVHRTGGHRRAWPGRRRVAGPGVRGPNSAPAPEATAYGRCTTRSDEPASAGSSSVESVSAGQLEAGLVLMRFHFLTHDGPVPDEVIVEIVDEVVLPLLRAASPSV